MAEGSLQSCLLPIKLQTVEMAALSNGIETLSNLFSGMGVDEKSMISTMVKWSPEQRKAFRKENPSFFIEDARHFERWDERQVAKLRHEFLRFKCAMVLWTMHPWERDARLIQDALMDGPKSYNVIVEIACTRSSDELLGARKAFHSLFDHSIEEQVASHVKGPERKLLVALVSSYRYEGPRFSEETAKSEANVLCTAIKSAGKKIPMEDEEVVRILSTRSKLHLKAVFKHYKEISGKNIDEDLLVESSLKDTVQCLSTPPAYFIKVLDAAMNLDADENTREGLTRVIVTRADVDMKEIKEEYQKNNGIKLIEKVENTAKGTFKDLLITLLARGN